MINMKKSHCSLAGCGYMFVLFMNVLVWMIQGTYKARWRITISSEVSELLLSWLLVVGFHCWFSLNLLAMVFEKKSLCLCLQYWVCSLEVFKYQQSIQNIKHYDYSNVNYCTHCEIGTWLVASLCKYETIWTHYYESGAHASNTD